MPAKLTEKDVLDMVRREHERKLERLKSDYSSYIKGDDDTKKKKTKSTKNQKVNKNKIDINTSVHGLLSRGLRVNHKDSGLEYAIVSVSPRDVILRTPEGRQFTVSAEEINKEYKLD
jgi:hypothetical protein